MNHLLAWYLPLFRASLEAQDLTLPYMATGERKHSSSLWGMDAAASEALYRVSLRSHKKHEHLAVHQVEKE